MVLHKRRKEETLTVQRQARIDEVWIRADKDRKEATRENVYRHEEQLDWTQRERRERKERDFDSRHDDG